MTHLLPHLSAGGAERQFSYLAPELVRMGHKVDVACLTQGQDRPDLNGVRVHRLVARSNHDPHLFWQLVRLIRRTKPDIIHTWILQMDILGGMAARLTGVPWMLREPSSAMGYLPTWKNRLRVRVGSSASAIVSNSTGGDQFWKEQSPCTRRYVIRNAIPVHEIDKAAADLPPTLQQIEPPIVLYVGRLRSDSTARKNLTALLRVLAYVRRQQKVVGILCGEGPQRPQLETLRHELGLDADVHFTGHLPISSVWSLMKKASLFVSLSAYEGCPNSVMEAMACGCPLVLSDIPAHREIAGESCALYVDSTNIRETADTMLHALSNEDASKARAVIAKQKSRKWSIVEMAGNYEKVYRESLACHVASC